ncbi:hypothetical protein FVER53590_05687 [Fusarium verticillioides]|nr:hypothetical protein FVER53590_05687 [Fusarium verticillioides]
MGKPLAIRSGGHQYSGASSTGSQGIQLDLKPTFRRPNIDLNILRENGKVYLRSSVSWQLTEIFDFLKDNGVFMPTGQCSTVCLGGHVQDRRISYTGFSVAVPATLDVLTHFKIEVQDDKNHQGSKGLWAGFAYKEETLKALLDILVQKGEDSKLPRGYDFTVNIPSRQANLLDPFPGSEDELKQKLSDDVHDGKDNIADLLKFKYAMIIVYAQRVNLNKEPYSPDLFTQIKNVPNEFKIVKEAPEDTPMSVIASMWLFGSPREFPYPYDKRTNSTTSTELSKTG